METLPKDGNVEKLLGNPFEGWMYGETPWKPFRKMEVWRNSMETLPKDGGVEKLHGNTSE